MTKKKEVPENDSDFQLFQKKLWVSIVDFLFKFREKKIVFLPQHGNSKLLSYLLHPIPVLHTHLLVHSVPT